MEERIRELLDNNNFKELKNYIKDINSVDLADILNDFKVTDVARVFRLIGKDDAVDVFSELDVTLASELLEYLSDKEAVNIIDELATDDATDVLEEMPANIVDKILKKCSPNTRKDINKLLKYDDDSAGSIMTVEYAELKGEYTIEKELIDEFITRRPDAFECLSDFTVCQSIHSTCTIIQNQNLWFLN